MTEDIPVSTYRLQLNSRFSFYTVNHLIDYFRDLGISHLYLSPCLRTRRGSAHGYAVSDFNLLNPEIGTVDEMKSIAHRLKKHEMGLILDFVPNHMGIFENPWWSDVLENGQSSEYAEFFDIDWHPVKDELHNKVLLPILEDFYGNVLDRGLLKLFFENGAFLLKYHEHKLPMGPGTYITILAHVLDNLSRELSQDDPHLIELQSIITACKNLPTRMEAGNDRRAERRREKEVVKRRLRDLYANNHRLRREFQSVMSLINGTANDALSHDELHELLEQQAYRLSYWLVASDEINYRRFFDINELAALNTEKEEVFNSSHSLLFDLVGKRIVDGLRIDHVDGLSAPGEYLFRLQNGYRNAVAAEIARQENSAGNGKTWLQQLFSPPANANVSPIDIDSEAPLYVVVEKILGEKELLRPEWPVYGTTGYEYGDALNGIFIDRRNAAAMLGTYRLFINRETNLHDIVYSSKNLVLRTSMAAELNLLAHQLNRLSEKSRHNRDFTLNNIRDALRTVIACFPVYRTYIDAHGTGIDENDRAIITRVIAAAKKRDISTNTPVLTLSATACCCAIPRTWMKMAGKCSVLS